MSAKYRTQPASIRLVDDLAAVGRDAWDALLAHDDGGNLFLRHDFLRALHTTGAATPRAGWAPQYLTLWGGDARSPTLAGAVPLYAKGHSWGEYVFDWAWADAYRRAGLDYYPKWLAAVPFTPVGGTRLIARDEAARGVLADALVALAADSGLSSLHVLLAPRAQIDQLAARGLLVRRGVQFHWRNAGYASFDHFLAALAQPKRKKIRAERRKVAEVGVTLTRKVGSEISEADWHFFYRCYERTYAEHGSTPYLTLPFFLRIGESLPAHLMLAIAARDGRPIAASLGMFDAHALYGRHWGALERVDCLHFECCYYQMIEFAIERGLPAFEGGAQGAHKLARGLDAVETLSAHWIADGRMRAAIERFAAREADQVGYTLDEMHEHRAFRPGAGAAAGPAREEPR